MRKSHKNHVFLRLRALEPRASATSRNVLGPGKIFPLPSSTTNGHPIFRGPVRRTSASVTRFFVMSHSSPSPKGRRAKIARDLSLSGVRLNGAIRPSPDVNQKVIHQKVVRRYQGTFVIKKVFYLLLRRYLGTKVRRTKVSSTFISNKL